MTLGDFKVVSPSQRLSLRVFYQFIIMPGLAFILVTIFQPPELAVGVICWAAAVGTSSNVMTYLKRRRSSFGRHDRMHYHYGSCRDTSFGTAYCRSNG